ncbi:UNVERIFIED_ORG: hypothetical protein ABIC48_005658 [Burkholderia territorii]
MLEEDSHQISLCHAYDVAEWKACGLAMSPAARRKMILTLHEGRLFGLLDVWQAARRWPGDRMPISIAQARISRAVRMARCSILNSSDTVCRSS